MPHKKHTEIWPPLLNVNAEMDIHRAVTLLRSRKTGDSLASLRALDASRETSHVKCNLAGLICLSDKENSLALGWIDRACSKALFHRGVALQELGRAGDALAA